MGLFDFSDPQNAGMMGLGMGLLSASGPSSHPVSLGQALGQGWQQGQQGYQDALQNQVKQAQIAEMKRKLEEEQAQREFFAKIGQYQQSPQQQAVAKFGPTLEGAAAIPQFQPQFDQQAMLRDMLKTPGMGTQALGLMMKDETPIALAEGGQLRTRTGALIASNPKTENNKPVNGYLVPDGQGGWKIDQAMFDAEARLKAAGRPSTTVNNIGERSFDKAYGTQLAEQYAGIQKGGFESNGKMARFDRIGQLLDGVSTGKLTPATTQISALADSLGVKIDPNLPSKQAALALSNEIAMQLRNPSGGAGMPGAMSDKDREFLMSMTPGLGNTPEGNRLLIETAKKLAERDQDVARMARDYKAKHGAFNENFYQEMAAYSNANPLFNAGSTASGNGWSAVKK